MSGKRDNVSRTKGSSPIGTSLFIGLRSLDVLFQYGILANGLADPLLNFLHVSKVEAPIVALGLPLKSLVMLSMAAGSSLKQNYGLAFLSEQEMPVGGAITISVFNTVFNSANSILSLTAAANVFTPSLRAGNESQFSPLLAISSVAYLVGLLTELVSEQQRTAFKKDPKNAGKPFTSGLFGLARHINYGAYTLWRGAYALASGGWIWGILVAGFFAKDFMDRGVPVLDEYCTKRYGASWAAYKEMVPYKLFPGVY
ncbi:hypothetical protein GQ53DRAFT_696836 [Thozetella sp. PMI_491]|nr:hypothetical protein GQ53DRAFT_696836 [Thozetella sp. PMI_491]